MRRTVLSLAVLAVLFGGTGCDGGPSVPPGPPEPETVSLDAALVTTALQGGLREMAVHLNNYGAEDEERPYSWHRSNDAYLRLGPSLGGTEVRFTIPESESKRGPFRFLYYVNDVNVLADSITVGLVDDLRVLQLAVRLPFEEAGREFKGHCLTDSFISRGEGCLGSKDRIAPDIELDDAFIEVTLRPVVHDGSLSFEAVDAAFTGTVQAGGICNVDIAGVAFDVCDALAGYEDAIRDALTGTVLTEFNRPDIQAQVAAGMRPFLDALGIGTVVSIHRAGDALAIEHFPSM